MANRAHRQRFAFYLVGAAGLGVVWYLGLSRSAGTSRILTEREWWNFRLPYWMLLTLLVAVSLSLALAFQQRIAASRTWMQHVLLALALPMIGTILFAWGVVVVGLLSGRSGEGDSVGEVLGFLVFIPLYALFAVWHALPTVLAPGVLSQFVMHVLARRIKPLAGGA